MWDEAPWLRLFCMAGQERFPTDSRIGSIRPQCRSGKGSLSMRLAVIRSQPVRQAPFLLGLVALTQYRVNIGEAPVSFRIIRPKFGCLSQIVQAFRILSFGIPIFGQEERSLVKQSGCVSILGIQLVGTFQDAVGRFILPQCVKRRTEQGI